MFGGLRKFRGKIQDLQGVLRNGRVEKDVEVLMFHRIGSLREYYPDDHCVSEEDFRKIISDISANQKVVPLEDIVSYLRGEKDIPDRSVAITFDDGFLSIKEKAVPILEEFDYPATIFVTSNFLDLEYNFGFALNNFLKENSELDFEWNGKNYSFLMDSKNDRIKTYEELQLLLDSHTSTIEEMRELLDRIGVDYTAEKGALLSERDIKNLDENKLISIGAHSTDHRRLTELESEEAKKSIVESKQRLEEVLGHEVTSFSFPFGSKNRELVEMVEEAGYDNAVVTEGREISERDWGNVYRIPRVDGKDL
jgi:peptidoglycan/xylan/chitin deacetylase (PgdA/CDA1 family)